MKGKRYLLLIGVLLLCTGCAVQDPENTQEAVYDSENTEEKESEEESRQISYIENYDIYGMTDPQESKFNALVAQNEIDAAYDEAWNEARTTEDMVSVQEEYADIWKEEMETRLEELLEVLPEDKASEFSEVQSNWEAQMLETARADLMVLDDTMGSAFRFIWLSNVREQYKNRTIHLRYLKYLISDRLE